ncbi:hypothetical protein Amsp01_001920 [Amycolatopsis sp. NBRC 101858]|uniref:hypothetical protein n=1 Tax=Amycolatopsis sp. NBRC 101858 TaxID=3032200 RepID=UPI0024A0FDF3|nr:hypothetical protein [Amycolatopsis sp. NBRC 101858]GLY34168.1 hypothetical protein Amsp01_001920 [Amycolatopsis sp. NBRC 101858]
MGTRGWYHERTLTTVDTVGREVQVSTGLTRDPEGRLVAAIAISDGPTAIFRYAGETADRTELLDNTEQTVKELRRLASVPPRV